MQLSDFTTNFDVPTCHTLEALAVAPSNPNYIYAAFGEPTWNQDMTTCTIDCTPNPNCAPHRCCTCTTSCPPLKKIFRTATGANANPIWTDITANLEAVKWAGITDITIHSENPNKVWVTFGGFWKDQNGVAHNRVNYSEDGGATWVDYSDGLLEFPVNCIVSEKGSNSGLYAGTDVGVYYTNKTLYQTDGWVCFSDNLPVAIVVDLEINYATNTIRAATHGRGIYESNLACPDDYNLSLSGISPADFYEAQNDITSNAVINSGIKVTYRAGNEIILTDGFTANTGSDFHAFIHPCDHAGNSFKKKNPGSGSGSASQGNNPLVLKTDEDISSNQIDQNAQQENPLPIGNRLFDNYPNPFSDHTHIDYSIKEESPVTLTISNICGNQVATLVNKTQHPAGVFSYVLNTAKLKAGIYFLTLKVGTHITTKKLVKIE